MMMLAIARQSVVQLRNAIICSLQRPRMHKKSREPSHRGTVWQRGVPKQSTQQWRGQLDLAPPNAFQFKLPICCLTRFQQHCGFEALAAQRQCTRVPKKCMPCSPPQQDCYHAISIACFLRLLEESLSDPNELRCAITSLSGEEYLQAGPTQLLSAGN